jgi:hypothetical protein
MNSKFLAYGLIGLGLIGWVGCTLPAEIEVDAEPVLHIEAVLYAGYPVPEILVRQTFQATGTDPFSIPRDALWATGASVELKRNGESVSVEETAPGRFRPVDASEIVRQGEVYDLAVDWEGRSASATARIPRFDTNVVLEVRAAIERVDEPVRLHNFETDRIDSLSVYYVRFELIQAEHPPVALFQVTTPDELRIEETYGVVGTVIEYEHPPTYRAFYRSETGLDSIVLSHTLVEIEPYQVQPTETAVRVIRVIPEEIYQAFAQTRSDFFAPVTVTNVQGGVGLFIGAVRDTLWFNQDIE